MKLIRLLLRTLPVLLMLLLPYAVRAQYTGVVATSTPGLNVRRALTTDPAVLFPPQRDYALMTGDVIRVTVYGVSPEFVNTERISADGSIRLNLAGVVKIGGLTPQQAELMLAQYFESHDLFHNAQVQVETVETPNRIITFVGEIKAAMPLAGQKRLLDMVSAAGGLPLTASSVIQIDRQDQAEPILVDLGNDPAHSIAANIPVFSGDVITVGRVGVFYVVGAVNHVGAVPLNGALPTTVLQALSATGGTSVVAKKRDARLVRTVGSTRTVIPLDLRAIERGQAPDPVLQSDDILLVPTSTLKSIFRLQTATSTIAIALSLTTLLR